MTKLAMPSYEEMRLETQARTIAQAASHEAIHEYFTPQGIPDDYWDIFVNARRAAELAAYLAVQKERELHAHELAELKAWRESRVAEEMLKAPSLIVPIAEKRTGAAESGSL